MKLFVKYLLVLVSDMLNREMLGFGILLQVSDWITFDCLSNFNAFTVLGV